VIWVPYRPWRSAAALAIGSAEGAAYMSGVPIQRAKLVAYTLSGLLASSAGLFVTFITYSGEASAANGSTYTLYSIAAVVLGGVSLFGGSGSAVGAIFGALMFRTIGDLLFVFTSSRWQPLFQGACRAAVCSAARSCARNRLDSMAEAWFRAGVDSRQRSAAASTRHVGSAASSRCCCSPACIRAASSRPSTCCSN
jgi:ribose transport system permease protein